MSRFRRVIHSVASGYFVLGANVVFSLASLPLALHYLSQEAFALWALMAGISGYLSLIDLGMSGSVARLLIDHKDERAGGVYGSLIKTGWLVLFVQAVIILLAGYVLAPLFASLLDIPDKLAGDFVSLLRWQSVVLAFSFATRIFSHLLTAHQRIDVVNYSQIGMLAGSYFLLWFFFSHGHGVFSWIWANGIGSIGSVAWLLPACWKLKLFPTAGAWGRARWQYFHELFGYGKDLFLVGVGTQLIVASQTMIITRTLGLQAAAAWSIGTKMFNLLSQLIWRVFDVSSPALSEMFVRGEDARLRDRYRAIVILSASFSAFVAVMYALCNHSFVMVWTHGRIDWPAHQDILLGAWMVVLAVLHCHNCFVCITKRIRFMRYVYFIEGIVFVTAALLVAPRGGLPAVIGCSIVCSALFSGAYGVWRVSKHFRVPVREVMFIWMLPMLKVLGLFLPVAVAAGWAFSGFPPEARLGVFAGLCAPAGLYLFLRFGLSNSFQTELLERAPKRINPLLRCIFITTPP